MTALPVLAPLRRITADVLKIAYYETGSEGGDTVVLLHGFPYDIHNYVNVAPLLAESGFRVIIPHLRGHGSTRFLSDSVPRSGQQAALGADVIALMDALNVEKAFLAGYDWGGRAATVAAALWPERVLGLVCVNGYLIQDIGAAMKPIAPELEAGFWYFYYFLTERGRVGLGADPRGLARVIWKRNSPMWSFSEADLSGLRKPSPTLTTSMSSSTLTGTGWVAHRVRKHTRPSKHALPAFPRSRFPRSPWTAPPTGTSRRPTGGPAPTISPVVACTCRCRTQGTICRRNAPRRSPGRCGTYGSCAAGIPRMIEAFRTVET